MWDFVLKKTKQHALGKKIELKKKKRCADVVGPATS
jgi:hypothetical protein